MKKFILSLFVGLFSLISFCSAEKVSNLIQVYQEGNFSIDANSNKMLASIAYDDYGVYCLAVNTWDSGGHRYGQLKYGRFAYSSETLLAGNYLNLYQDQVPLVVCFYANQPYLGLTNDLNYAVSFDYVLYNFGDLLDTDLPVMSSSECQLEYNLIPVDSVDTNYCVENDLCPVNECIGSGTWSNIYINDILHPGEENVFVDIPDYIQWDYSVTTGEFNIYVGSGYDMDYMNSIIKINSYRPDSTDFTDIFVSGLTLIFPYIFVLLLIVFIWKLIKRIFK